MKVIIIGLGSIGKRHFEILKMKGHEPIIVSKHDRKFSKYSNIKDSAIENGITHIIISNNTADHYKSLSEALKYFPQAKILVEKPLFEKVDQEENLQNTSNVFVGYNLRFFKGIELLKEKLVGQKVLSSQISCSSYLPHWRVGGDYRQSYSASKKDGGGVLRDISHEIDLIQYLLGPIESLVGEAKKISSLEIDSEDFSMCMMKNQSGSYTSLYLDYFSREAMREIIITTNELTLKLDLLKCEFFINGDPNHFDGTISNSYENMQCKFLAESISGTLCSYDEGLNILKTIEKIEESSEKKQWVNL